MVPVFDSPTPKVLGNYLTSKQVEPLMVPPSLATKLHFFLLPDQLLVGSSKITS
jgi:hypothetical protein